MPQIKNIKPEVEKEIPYWPYCPKCHTPIVFDEDEPFASCDCIGTMEWGYPRPAPWVPNPHFTRQQVAFFSNLNSDNCNIIKALMLERDELKHDLDYAQYVSADKSKSINAMYAEIGELKASAKLATIMIQLANANIEAYIREQREQGK